MTETKTKTNALQERLNGVRTQRGPAVADRLARIGKDCAKRLKEPFRSADHGNLLYDKEGLPQ